MDALVTQRLFSMQPRNFMLSYEDEMLHRITFILCAIPECIAKKGHDQFGIILVSIKRICSLCRKVNAVVCQLHFFI